MAKHVHFIGIGGAGMAPAAAMAAESGLAVSGSDTAVYPPASDFLRERGLTWFEGYRAENLAPPPDLVVVGNALSRGNPEVEETLDRDLPYLSLPEFLRDYFLAGRRVTVVAGTHGKTTITTLLAWILEAAGRSPSFFAGGFSLNFSSSCRLGEGPDFIIEGDEYDTAFFDKRSKFLLYRPRRAVLANLEYDHADIFPSLDAYRLTFAQLVNTIPRRGALVVNGEDALAREAAARAFCRVIPVEAATHRWVSSAPLPGTHYLMNARLAAAAAEELGVGREEILRGIASYRGVRRRLERVFEEAGVILYDDFAHHPTSIRLDLEALRSRHPDARIRTLFEPRSNTVRRRIFQDELAAAFAAADDVIIGAVHRAALLDEAERLDCERLAREISAAGGRGRHLTESAGIVRAVLDDIRSGDVIVAMSNGAFDGLIPRLKEELTAWAQPGR